MESSSIRHDQSFQINDTELKISFCQKILAFPSVCFIVSQVSDHDSELKHRYASLKDHLKELTRIGLLKTINSGVKSGKNQCILYIKQLPSTLTSNDIETFSSKYLKHVRISWSTYLESCRRVILSSESAILSPQTLTILNSDVYNCIIAEHELKSVTLDSTTLLKSKQTCSKKSKNQRKVLKKPIKQTNQNSILKYFHRTITKTPDSTMSINEQFSTNHDKPRTVDASSNAITSNIIKSKYFPDEK